jgi:hypothetical protein
MYESALDNSSETSQNFAGKGKKHVDALISAKSARAHDKVVACVSSAGQCVPSVLTFHRKQFSPSMYANTPSGNPQLSTN